MFKNILISALSLGLFTAPIAVSAQTATISPSSNTALIALLTQLVQVLEQELQQLITAQRNLVPQTIPVAPASKESSGVFINSSAEPSATIDQSSLDSNDVIPSIRGTASNTTTLNWVLFDHEGNQIGQSDDGIPVSHGGWRATIYEGNGSALGPGSYELEILDSTNSIILTYGTLIVR